MGTERVCLYSHCHERQRVAVGIQTHKFCVHFTNRFGPEYKAELARSCDCVTNSGWKQKHKMGLKPNKTVSVTRLNTILCNLVSPLQVNTMIDFCNQWIKTALCLNFSVSEWCVFFVSRGLCPNMCFVSTYSGDTAEVLVLSRLQYRLFTRHTSSKFKA